MTDFKIKDDREYFQSKYLTKIIDKTITLETK